MNLFERIISRFHNYPPTNKKRTYIGVPGIQPSPKGHFLCRFLPFAFGIVSLTNPQHQRARGGSLRLCGRLEACAFGHGDGRLCVHAPWQSVNWALFPARVGTFGRIPFNVN